MMDEPKPRTQEERTRFWVDRIKKAKQARSDQEKEWSENRDMCNSVSYRDTLSEHSRVWKPIFLSTLNVVVPHLVFRAPQFTALPKREEDARTYQIAEMHVNHAVAVTSLKRHAKQAVQDGLIASVGYLKVGYIVDHAKVKVKVDDESGNVEVVDESKGHGLSGLKVEERTIGVGSRPFTVRVSPWNLIRSRGSTSVHNAAWVAERIFMRHEEVRANPYFKNTANINSNSIPRDELKGVNAAAVIASSSTDEAIEEGVALADPDDKLVELWEIWDRVNNKLMVVVDGHDKFLRDEPWPYDLNGAFPYVELQFIKISDIPYPIAFLSICKDLVREANIIASYELDHVKRATPIVTYDKNRTDEDTADQFAAGGPVRAIGVNGDPTNAFFVVGGAPLNADLKWVDMKNESDIDAGWGIPDFMRNRSHNGESATLSDLKAQSAGVRIEDMIDTVSDWMVEWAQLIDMIGKQFADRETSIRITGKAGFTWGKFTKEDIAGEYEYQLVPGSLQPVNRDVMREEMLKLFNLLASFIDPAELKINGTALVRKILELWPMHGADKILNSEAPPPPADPAEENFLMSIGGNPVVSPQEDIQDHRNVHLSYVDELRRQPQPDEALIARVLDHVKQTDRMEVQLLVEQQMEQMAAAQAMGGMAERQPGQPGNGPPRGKGAGGPAANGPVRPRQFNTETTSRAGVRASAQQPAPGGTR
jgi:hypothetical protein